MSDSQILWNFYICCATLLQLGVSGGWTSEDRFECKEAIHAVQSTFPGANLHVGLFVGAAHLKSGSTCDQIYSQLFYYVAFLFTDFVRLLDVFPL
jgi:hypothetical protein